MMRNRLPALFAVTLFLCGAVPNLAADTDKGMYSTYKTPVEKAIFDRAFDASAEADLNKVVRQMYMVLDRLTRYRIPKVYPEIYRLPHAELEKYVCGTHCSIKAWYKSGDGIYLDDSLKPETNIFDRSILLHEIVHFLQDRAGEYGSMDDCNRWFHREVDAYTAQNRYLGVMGHPSRVAFTGDNCGVDTSTSANTFNGKPRQAGPEQ